MTTTIQGLVEDEITVHQSSAVGTSIVVFEKGTIKDRKAAVMLDPQGVRLLIAALQNALSPEKGHNKEAIYVGVFEGDPRSDNAFELFGIQNRVKIDLKTKGKKGTNRNSVDFKSAILDGRATHFGCYIDGTLIGSGPLLVECDINIGDTATFDPGSIIFSNF